MRLLVCAVCVPGVLTSLSRAAEAPASGQKKVIDLGKNRVERSLRLPPLQTIESESAELQKVPEIYKHDVQELEELFLRPLTQDELAVALKKSGVK